jgi:hypothetical protein
VEGSRGTLDGENMSKKIIIQYKYPYNGEWFCYGIVGKEDADEILTQWQKEDESRKLETRIKPKEEK